MRTWIWLSTPVVVAVLGLSGRAAAQECASDDDCLKGYLCEVVGESGCGFACPDSDPNCAPPPDSMCDTVQYKACVAGPCTSDADCEDGMVCFEQEISVCPLVSEIDCPPGADCPKPDPAATECTTETSASCVPRYALPCEEAADCGEGFDCVEDIAYACAGSVPSSGSSGGGSDPGAGEAGAAAPEPDVSPPPAAPVCTEEPTGTFHCEAQEVACEADADCPSDWTCAENFSRPVCGGTSNNPGQATPAACPDAIPELCRMCADDSCGEAVCVDGSWSFVCPEDPADGGQAVPTEPVPPVDDCGLNPAATPERICAPPFSDLGWGGVPGGLASQGGVALGTPTSDPRAPSPAPEAMADGTDDATATGGDKDQSLGGGETAMEPKADSGGSCAVSAPGGRSGGAVSLLGLFGLCLLGLRRRIRA